MAWPGVPSGSLPPPPPLDMKMYEMMETVRSMQSVQAEQSRRLDEQSLRLHQLEVKDTQNNRFESQRYLWGPGAVGSAPSRGLPGLGFEVFSPPMDKERVKVEMPVDVPENVQTKDTIETDIDNLLLSPTLSKDSTIVDPPSRSASESPAPQNNVVGYFPYVLAVQCWLGGRQDRPPTDADMVTAQINTAVHASFIDSALVHHLGVTHRIRNRRPTRYQSRFTGYARPRILLPVYIPIDASLASTASESQVAKIHIDFVVVNTHDMTPLDHQKLARLEIGAQSLFLHGMDILFSTRSLRVSGLNIPLATFAPRDQKRLLSSIVTPVPNTQNSWERVRRQRPEEHEAANGGWTEDTTLLRDTSTNSSISSTSAYHTTAVTSPAMTEAETSKEPDVETIPERMPTPPSTVTTFSTGALQFIPSSVVARPVGKTDDSSGSRSSTLQLEESRSTHEDTCSRSSTLQLDNLPSRQDVHQSKSKPTIQPLPALSPTLDVQTIPSRKSSLVEQPLSPIPDDGPRLPSNLIDKVVQRKTSSTWPRALGKKVAPWTSIDATKTSILGTTFDEPTPPAPRRMKILKPVRSPAYDENKDVFKDPKETRDVFKVDVIRDVVRVEVKDKDEEHVKCQIGKNVGGGAFHWMK